MTDRTTVVAVPAPHSSYIEWSPIIGGAVIASALSFILFTFGSAAGVASVSPYSWSNPSGTTMSIIAVVFVLLVMIGTAMAGGFFAGRFRRPTAEAYLDEREHRDGAHGLLVWGLCMIVGIVLGAMAVSATVRGAASAVSGAASTASQSVSSGQVNSAIDTLMRPSAQAAPGARPGDDPRATISRILSSSTLTRGEISNEDRTYMAQLVSQQAGIPQDEARRRVDATIEQAKAAANQARKAAAILAFLLGAASIVSAGAAYWAATMGGAQRDRAIGARL